ncbi:GNAT family N-acetyltransferase [Rubripirellula reticaptiva]|uniref:Putative acetyltransferase n=1 Tax=Rubripirellula reticaptiva TaxID=2528013 RepID=A0A5C6EGH5_9BACT|nr:GNAT family N-acetyltransferase [Rubripirellula reticaptiva]TWU47137.1 putative acetyltransferase [Rubripirellula reticaptiva]
MIEISTADLSSPEHAGATLSLLETYAADIMGGGKSLSPHTRTHLVDELRNRENCVVVLAWADDVPAGMAICFEGFSTFSCQAILNIHDFVVAAEFRRQGIAMDLLAKIQEVAVERKCCKLTLEVLEGNHVAQRAYQKFGFAGYELDPEMGRAMFYEKKLSHPPSIPS